MKKHEMDLVHERALLYGAYCMEALKRDALKIPIETPRLKLALRSGCIRMTSHSDNPLMVESL
jgi:hypothetical protein